MLQYLVVHLGPGQREGLGKPLGQGALGLVSGKALGDGLLKRGGASRCGAATVLQLRGVGRGYDHHALPADLAAGRDLGGKLGRHAAHALLVELSELAHERHAPRRKDLGHVGLS